MWFKRAASWLLILALLLNIGPGNALTAAAFTGPDSLYAESAETGQPDRPEETEPAQPETAGDQTPTEVPATETPATEPPATEAPTTEPSPATEPTEPPASEPAPTDPEPTQAPTDPEPTQAPTDPEPTQAPTEPKPAPEAAEDPGPVYADGVIHIFNYDQLKLIGSGQPVLRTDPKGREAGACDPAETIRLTDGSLLTYGLDGDYTLEADIPLPDGELWRLPEGFTGELLPAAEEGRDPVLYDPETDTVYLHNTYQLEYVYSDQGGELPLISGDVREHTLGSGKLVYDSNGQYLTYSPDHRYVIAADFGAEDPNADAQPVSEWLRVLRGVNSNDDLIEGRSFFGQVTVTIEGTRYILIGDRQQLDAINSASSTNSTRVYGPVYRVYQRRQSLGNWNDDNIVEETRTLIYPGDADLLDDIWTGAGTQSFATEVMYSGNNGLLSSDRYHSLTDILDVTGYDRTFYAMVDENGNLTRTDPTLTYRKDGNYIIFRDIDMRVHTGEDTRDSDDVADAPAWTPLMFSGNLYGITSPGTAQGTLAAEILPVIRGTDAAHTVAVTRRPTISYVNVVPATKTQLGSVRLDLNVQSGVGFFGTLQGEFSQSSLVNQPIAVRNIRLDHCYVNNPAVRGVIDASAVQLLLTGLGWVLEEVLSPVLSLLVDEDASVDGLLTSLLNTRQSDPSSLATGAFAGRVLGDTVVQYCEVDHVLVQTVVTAFENGSLLDNSKKVLVGKGAFIGMAEGTTQYEGLSSLLGGAVNALSGLLNLIPGVGLGDLVDLLLKNAANVGELIPTGYASPQLLENTARHASLTNEGTPQAGKYGVGGFAGTLCGTILSDCTLADSDGLTVNAANFGGGFVGVMRDALIGQTLSGLGIDVGLHPQSELIRCHIVNSDITVTGGSHLGGFAGSMNNSYAINCDSDEDSSLTVTGTGDFAGGFAGELHLGTAASLGDFLRTEGSLTSVLNGLVGDLLGSGPGQALLEVGGVAPAAIMGCQLHGEVRVIITGGYAGGLVGRGNGSLITSSQAVYLRKLAKYNKKSGENWEIALPITAAEARGNQLDNLVLVAAGHAAAEGYSSKSYAGGLAGYLTSANVGGLLGKTAGLGQFLGYTVCDTRVTGVEAGCRVYAEADVAAGGIGWAVGGDVYDVELENLASVSALNHAGGFVGITGPGDLVGGDGLDVSLLGIQLLSIDNLLSVAQCVRSAFLRANVTGIETGFTVEERGLAQGGDKTEYVAGGYAATANSVTVTDCHVSNLLWVKANLQDGGAAGFVASSAAGGLAGLLSDEAETLQLAQINGLLGAVPYLIPKYDGCDVTFVDGGCVQGDAAGGFTAFWQSGQINTQTTEDGVTAASYQKYPDDTYPADDPEHPEYAARQAETVTFTVGTPANPWSVRNIHHVRGGTYGGGWGGKVWSGSLASAGSGLSLLGGHGDVGTIDLAGLLSLVNAYVPIIKYAGVFTDSETQRGFSVYAAHDYEDTGAPATEGYAGGFIGCGSGVEISYSSVNKLKTGTVTPPDYLEDVDAPEYMTFDNNQATDAIPYAVAGAYYAGGYIGHMDVGSSASLGDGLKLLDELVNLSDVLSALNAVVSTIEHSHVYGAPGGFNVIASPRINNPVGLYGDADGEGVGYAGGFAGRISGGHIQDSNVELFEYIVGEVAAGGYVGWMEPGDVANVLGDGSLFSKLANVSSLASLVQDFVPTVRNSQTTCVPCGGAVRAQTPSDRTGHPGNQLRGLAGGYVGYLKGGHIWGCSTDPWKAETTYTGPQRECAAIRIRSVYGAEYAGGWMGLMECGSTASTGGLSLLGGLIDASNVIGALEVVYPTVRYGRVTGSLRGVDFDTFKLWAQYVGLHGAFAAELNQLLTDINNELVTADNFAAELENYIYGYNVRAGRTAYDNYALTVQSGCAGGFVGAMHSGVIMDSAAIDAKDILAMRAVGGYVGEMMTKGLAEFGSVSILGLGLNLGSLLDLGEVLVPSIARSGVTGYPNGLRVQATGDPSNRSVADLGNGGGFAGASFGGQIGLPDGAKDPAVQAAHPNDSAADGATVWVENLLQVKGTYAVGGFMGKSAAASVLTADTSDASNGLVQNLLNDLINESNPGKLIDVLRATVSTVKNAKVTPQDEDWGIVVDGSYDDGSGVRYAPWVGGFAGSLESTVLGERDNENDRLVLTGLRYVIGGEYVGGFFGLADVGSVAQVGTGTTTLLNLIQAGSVGVLDAFRTYIYHAQVTGVREGIRVTAYDWQDTGTMSTYYVSGAAGGFGGAMMNGTIEHSTVTGVSNVQAPNYAGGFVGYLGKNKLVNVDQAQVEGGFLASVLSALGLNLNLNAQVLNIIGATVTDCAASGIPAGMILRTTETQDTIPGTVDAADVTGSCTGGFAGYADITQMEDCHVTNLKQVVSPQVAGGFLGRGSMAFVADVDLSSGLTGVVVLIVNALVRALYLPEAERLNLLNLDGGLLGLKLLADGDLLYVNLLGLKIGVTLIKNDPEYEGSDAAVITLGSSTIKVPCDENGIQGETPDITINLFEGNRTTVKYSSVTGVDTGYDVHGGGYAENPDKNGNGLDDDEYTEGSGLWGYAGGFIGYNDNGFFSHDTMDLCDVIGGAPEKVGPFTGGWRTNSRPIDYLEGYVEGDYSRENYYYIYRTYDPDNTYAVLPHGSPANAVLPGEDVGVVGDEHYNRYAVLHRQYALDLDSYLDATQEGTGTDLAVRQSAARADLMLGVRQPENPETLLSPTAPRKDPCDDEFDLTLRKVWQHRYNPVSQRPQAVRFQVFVERLTQPPDVLVSYVTSPYDWLYYYEVVLTEADAQTYGEANPNVWLTTLTDLKVYEEDAGGNPRYYKYYVYEVPPEDYRQEYSLDQETGSVTVTNIYTPSLLPETGGPGVSQVQSLAGLLTLTGTLLLYLNLTRRRRERRFHPRD